MSDQGLPWMGRRLWGQKVRLRVLDWRVDARKWVAGSADLLTTYGYLSSLAFHWRCHECLQLPAVVAGIGKEGRRV